MEHTYLRKRCIAISDNHVLFRVDYNKAKFFYLVQLGDNHNAKLIKIIEFLDEDNKRLDGVRTACRKDKLYMLSGNKVYSLSIGGMLDELIG